MRTTADILDIIARAKKDLEELKNRQIISNKSIIIKESQTSNEWDVNQDITLTNTPGNTSRAIFGYFIADRQEAPFAEFRAKIKLNNVDYNTATDERLNFIDFGLNAPFFVAVNPTNEQMRRMAFHRTTLSSPTYPVTINVKIKYKVLATDSGVVRAVVVAPS